MQMKIEEASRAPAGMAEGVVEFEFDRLPRESVKAFTSFRAYLDMGADRSLRKVAAKLNRNPRVLARWSRKYDWPGRIAAHVRYIAKIEREAIEGLAREKAVEWHLVHEDQKIAEWKLRTKYLEMALEGVERWKASEHRVGSLEGLARLGEVFVKLGRLASGMPTEIKEVNKNVTATLDVHWEVALKKIYGKESPVIDAEVAGEQPGQIGVPEVQNTGSKMQNTVPEMQNTVSEMQNTVSGMQKPTEGT